MNLTQDGQPPKVHSGVTVANSFSSPMLGGVEGIGQKDVTDVSGVVYSEKVLALGPIAYWPLWEASGLTAECLVNPAQDGTYSGDVSAWPPATGIGDGNTAPTFDAAGDYINIVTAALQAAFDGDEGTAMIWAKVANVGAWTDGTTRVELSLWADDNNQVQLSKVSNNNELWFRYIAGAVGEDMREFGISTTDWFHHCITWSKSNDRTRAYRDGTLITSSATLGVWAGNLNALATRIGNLLAAGANGWLGWLAHCALFDYELSQPQVARVARV